MKNGKIEITGFEVGGRSYGAEEPIPAARRPRKAGIPAQLEELEALLRCGVESIQNIRRSESTGDDLGADRQREVVMGKSGTRMTCTVCGKKRRNVWLHYGELACPDCAILRSNIINRTETVLDQLRRLVPDTMEAIEAEATAAERARLDELQRVLDPATSESLEDCARRRIKSLVSVIDKSAGLVIENIALKERSAERRESSLLARLREILQAGDGDIVTAARRLVEKADIASRPRLLFLVVDAIDAGRVISLDADQLGAIAGGRLNGTEGVCGAGR